MFDVQNANIPFGIEIIYCYLGIICTHVVYFAGQSGSYMHFAHVSYVYIYILTFIYIDRRMVKKHRTSACGAV